MDPLEDLQKTVEAAYDELPDIYRPIYDITDYDYDKEWINAPAAFGDTYKYIVSYVIGDFYFEYEHICVHETGIITNYKFRIGKEYDENNINDDDITDNRNDENDETTWQDFTHESSYVKEFMEKYNTNDKYTYNDFCYILFGLLNSWTLGHAIQPCLQTEDKIFNQYGFNLECLPLSDEQREKLIGTPDVGETVNTYYLLTLD